MPYEHVLTDHEKRELLRIARATLKEHLMSGRIPPGAPHRQSLLDPAPVFVTLKTGEHLRGCIGTIHDTSPLFKAVQEMAIAAASRDPRFDPIAVDEIGSVHIEISVLGPRVPITDLSSVEIGRHGLCITLGSRRGLLLPQVAVENGWNAEQFAARTCEKAGLPGTEWKNPSAVLERFAAQVFDDRSFPPVTGSLVRK